MIWLQQEIIQKFSLSMTIVLENIDEYYWMIEDDSRSRCFLLVTDSINCVHIQQATYRDDWMSSFASCFARDRPISMCTSKWRWIKLCNAYSTLPSWISLNFLNYFPYKPEMVEAYVIVKSVFMYLDACNFVCSIVTIHRSS